MLAVLPELVRCACVVYRHGVRNVYCRRIPSLAAGVRLRSPQLPSQMELLPSVLPCLHAHLPALVGWSSPPGRLPALVLRVLVD